MATSSSYIKIRRGDLLRLSKATGYSKETCCKSLCGHLSTPAARKIRYVAVKEFGGVELVPKGGAE